MNSCSPAGKVSRIMIVDDEPGVLNALRRLLHIVPCTYGRLAYKLEIETFASPLEALERARAADFDVFLADYRMPVMNGVEFLHAVMTLQPDAARLIFSGYSDLNAFADAVDGAHIYRFLSKPWNDYVLVSAIAEALNYRDVVLENRQLAGAAGAAAGAGGAAMAAEPVLADAAASATAATKVRWGEDGSAIVDERAPHERD